MLYTYEVQEPILDRLLKDPWFIATMPSFPLAPGRTQFNIWTGDPNSRIVTLDIDPTTITHYASIKASFVRQLEANGVPHR